MDIVLRLAVIVAALGATADGSLAAAAARLPATAVPWVAQYSVQVSGSQNGSWIGHHQPQPPCDGGQTGSGNEDVTLTPHGSVPVFANGVGPTLTSIMIAAGSDVPNPGDPLSGPADAAERKRGDQPPRLGARRGCTSNSPTARDPGILSTIAPTAEPEWFPVVVLGNVASERVGADGAIGVPVSCPSGEKPGWRGRIALAVDVATTSSSQLPTGSVVTIAKTSFNPSKRAHVNGCATSKPYLRSLAQTPLAMIVTVGGNTRSATWARGRTSARNSCDPEKARL